MAITPDRMQGRVLAVITTLAMSLASVSALFAGAFVQWWGGPATILAFAAIIAISAVTATLSKGLRDTRPLSESEATA